MGQKQEHCCCSLCELCVSVRMCAPHAGLLPPPFFLGGRGCLSFPLHFFFLLFLRLHLFPSFFLFIHNLIAMNEDRPIRRANALRIRSEHDQSNDNTSSENNASLTHATTDKDKDSKEGDHQHLTFYEVHMATAHTIYDPSSSSYSHLHPSRRRHYRNKKRFADNPNSKGHDLYADLVIVFKFKGPPKALRRFGSSASMSDSPTSPPSSRPSSTASQSSPLMSIGDRIELEQKTMDAYEELLTKLSSVGLRYETRPSGKETILIFILCPWTVLRREVTRHK